jgi:monovalent cation:H+ antiporter-2, CPA2 family
VAVTGANFLLDLALVTVVAAATTLLFHRLKQPVVLGYVLAGVLIGPHNPFGLPSPASIQTLAELGIVFLMFSIGLEFRLQRLARAGLPALGAALASMVVVAAATIAASGALGWSTGDALFLGAILAISSTVIAAKAMVETGQHGRRWADLAMGVLIVQDVAAIAILAVLGSGGGDLGVLDVLGLLGRIATFAMTALVLGLLFVPPLVNRLARARADEVLVVTLAGLALGVAALATFLGFSPALGAFLIGAVVAEASEPWLAEQRVHPLRDLFTAVFFVSIGMLLDPALLAAHWPAALGLGLLMVVLKVAFHAVPAFLLGAPPKEGFKASLAVAQIGEFSFVIASLGIALGVVSDFVLPVTVGIATASALWTPYFLRASDRAYDLLGGAAPQGLRAAALRYQEAMRHRAAQARLLDAAQRRLLGRAALNLGAVLLILLATAGVGDLVEAVVTVRGLTDKTLALLPWLAGGVLALPFAFNAGLALLALARRAVGPLDADAPGLNRTRAALLVGGSALLVFIAFLAAAPFLPPLPLLLLSLAAFMGAAIVLWEFIVRLHARVADTLVQALGGEAQGDERLAVLDALREEYRWGLEVERFRVEAGTVAAVATVGGLDLRARTGATLVAVRRRGHTLVNPAPGFVFEAGDALLLLGDAAQLEKARELLAEPAGDVHRHGEEPRFAQLRVEDTSPLAGQTLAGAALRERTGATIVGILRGGTRLASPGAATRIEPGDVLLVVGAEEELRSAAALVRERAAAALRDTVEPGPNV